MKLLTQLTGLVLLIGSSMMVHAESLQKNMIHLSASASSEVKNDLMVVRLNTQHQAKEAATAAAQVNQDMVWALKEIKRFSDIDVQTEQYNTYPMYKDEKIRSWQASQTVRLQSENAEDMTKALLVLQAKLNVQSMSFKPTQATRKKAADALIEDALHAFNQRAALIQKTLHSGGYTLVEIHVNTQNQFSPVYQRAESYAMMNKSVAAAPAVESGKSSVSVTVNGTIQLQ